MTIRWGIVTASKIGNDFVNAINTYPGRGDQVVAAIAARDKTRAADFAKLHNIPKVFDSYQALAASKDIDVAYIGALNPDHYELTKLFLENGKHVLCEKPLTLNSKQTENILNLAKQKKLFLMEAVWTRFVPSLLALEKEINSGKLGEVKFVEVNFGINIPLHIERVGKKELGGGATLDVGVYVIQLAQFVFKEEPTKVTSFGELNESGVDTAATIVLEYSGGRRAVLNINTQLQMWNKATIVGTNGRVTVEDPFHCSTKLIHVDGKEENFPIHQSNLPYNFLNSAYLVYESLEVVRCIKEGLLESPRMSHKESIIIAKIQDSVRKQIGVHFDVDD